MATKKLINIGLACAIAIGSIAMSATPAAARDGWNHNYYAGDYYRGYDRDRGYRDYRAGDHYRQSNYDRGYDRRYRYNDRRCHDNGTGGAVIGAIAGGLLGNSVARRGDKTTGTVVGGALGAVTGHLIDKSDGRRC